MLKPASERLHPMELRLTPPMLEAIDHLATGTGDSRSEVVRHAIEVWREAGAPVDGATTTGKRITADKRIVKVTVYLLPEQVLYLDELAQRLGTTRSHLLRAAVTYYLGLDRKGG